jgi:hypothetical protein
VGAVGWQSQLGPERSHSLPPPSTFGFTSQPPNNVLPELVGDSGGVVYPIIAPETAATAGRAVIQNLRSLYTLGYAPAKAADGRYRRVTVGPRNRELRVRHRTGYLSRAPQ